MLRQTFGSFCRIDKKLTPFKEPVPKCVSESELYNQNEAQQLKLTVLNYLKGFPLSDKMYSKPKKHQNSTNFQDQTSNVNLRIFTQQLQSTVKALKRHLFY